MQHSSNHKSSLMRLWDKEIDMVSLRCGLALSITSCVAVPTMRTIAAEWTGSPTQELKPLQTPQSCLQLYRWSFIPIPLPSKSRATATRVSQPGPTIHKRYLCAMLLLQTKRWNHTNRLDLPVHPIAQRVSWAEATQISN